MNNIQVYPQPQLVKKHEASYQLHARCIGEEDWIEIPIYAVTVDMHDPREAGLAQFDFEGAVEIRMTFNKFRPIYKASIHPLSLNLVPICNGSQLTFVLEHPQNIAVIVNDDWFHNLHLFTNKIVPAPDKQADNVLVIKEKMTGVTIMQESGPINERIKALGEHPIVYFEKGYHSMGEFLWKVPSNTTIYLEGGAVFRGGFILEDVENVKIYGRGIVDQKDFGQLSGAHGFRIQRAKNITLEDLTVINPGHYTVYIGDSQKVMIRNLRSFSCEGWTDGIDMMSSQDITVSGGFLRTSDDCIAIYGSRWQNYGDTKNVLIENITLWADVAHPMMVGTHGDHQGQGDIIEELVFRNIDVIDQHEMQPDYMGVMAIAPGDLNLVRNVLFEDVRVEKMSHGRLFDFRVKHNLDYNPHPGRGIEDVRVKNIYVQSSPGEEPSLISGFDDERLTKNIQFENLVRNGKRATTIEEGNISVGPYTANVVLR